MSNVKTKLLNARTSIEQLFNFWQEIVENPKASSTLFLLVGHSLQEANFLLKKMRRFGKIECIDLHSHSFYQEIENEDLFFDPCFRTIGYVVHLGLATKRNVQIFLGLIQKIFNAPGKAIIVVTDKNLRNDFQQQFPQRRCICLDWSEKSAADMQERYLAIAQYLVGELHLSLDDQQIEKIVHFFGKEPHLLENELIKASLCTNGTNSQEHDEIGTKVWQFIKCIELKDWTSVFIMLLLLDHEPSDIVGRWLYILRKHLSSLFSLYCTKGESHGEVSTDKKQRAQLSSLKRLSRGQLIKMLASFGAVEAAVRLGEASHREALQAWILGIMAHAHRIDKVDG